MKPKRIISLLVAVCMMVAMLPVSALTAFADTNMTAIEAGNIKYLLNDDGTAFVNGVGESFPKDQDIVIPSTVEYGNSTYSVTAIYAYAFGVNGGSALTGKITIPNSVTTIGERAFAGCDNLSGELIIPGSVKSIGTSAFEGCKAFTHLTISDGVEEIGSSAFRNCTGLTGELKLPDSIKSIGTYAFSSLGVQLSALPDHIETIGMYAFYNCRNFTGTVTIPDTLKNLGQHAFDSTNIEKVVLPKSIVNTTIEQDIVSANTKIIYPGTYSELKQTLSNNNNISDLDESTLKMGKNYICYLCDVTFDIDGGTPTSEPQNKIYRTSLLDIDKINTPSKEGYVFDGWYYTDSTGKETKFDPAKDKVTDSMTLKAKWTVPAAVTVSGLPDGELAQGKQYPFTVAIDPKDDDGGKGGLKIEVGSEDSLYRKLNNGKWQLATTGNWSVDLEKGEYSFMLVPGQTGPDSLNVTLTKNGITDPRDTVTIDFTVREYQNAEVSLEGLDNVTFKQGEPQEFSVRVTPNDDSGKACLDFGKDNADIEYQENGEWKQMPEDGLTIDLDEGEQVYALRYTPQLGGKNQSLRVTVKPVDSDFGKNETTIDIAAKAKKSLTLTGGTVKVNGEEVALDADKECVIEEGSTVEVTFDKSILSDAQVFDQWSIKPDSVLNAVDPKAETITFKMPAEKVTIEAMTRDASIQEEPNILGTAAVIGIGVAGTAVLGYQGYMIGTELYLKNVMPAGAAIPQNYGELALLVWNDAGQPAPAAVLAADATDEQKALTWAVENQLISADKAADASVTRWEVIQTWNQEQEMKH